jgi:hypothetical protein
MRSLVLAVHVLAGTAGLLLGPLWLLTGPASRRRPLVAGGYQVAVAVLTGTALLLVAFDAARLWWLVPVAVATEAAALGGRWAARHGHSGWQIRLLGGSYVALVTALLVVSWFTWLSWVLPAAITVPVIEYAAFRSERRRASRDLAVTG